MEHRGWVEGKLVRRSIRQIDLEKRRRVTGRDQVHSAVRGDDLEEPLGVRLDPSALVDTGSEFLDLFLVGDVDGVYELSVGFLGTEKADASPRNRLPRGGVDDNPSEDQLGLELDRNRLVEAPRGHFDKFRRGEEAACLNLDLGYLSVPCTRQVGAGLCFFGVDGPSVMERCRLSLLRKEDFPVQPRDAYDCLVWRPLVVSDELQLERRLAS